MSSLQLKIRTVPRTSSLEDDAVGEELVALVRKAVGKGPIPAVGVRVRTEAFDLFPLKPVIDRKLNVGHFLASLTRLDGEPAEAVGLMGQLRYRPHTKAPAIGVGAVFLEWSDCRWWHWRCFLDAEGSELMDETEVYSGALSGDPLPRGLGRWWSLGRRKKIRASIARSQVDVPQGAQKGQRLVH